MMRIGQMQREAQEREERRQVRPDILYRVTSPVFWLGRLWALIRWLVVTKGGRIAGLVVAAVVTAFVTGVGAKPVRSIASTPAVSSDPAS
jgi:hypothetical protein